MSIHDANMPQSNSNVPQLELNKETLKDLDVEPASADKVKGGNVSNLASTSRVAQPIVPNPVVVSTSRP